MLLDPARHNTGIMIQAGFHVERDPVIADPFADPDADSGNLVLATGAAVDPDTDSAGASFALHSEFGEGDDQPFLKIPYIAADIAAASRQIQHHISDDLARAVIGILAAAASAIDRKAVRCQQVFGAGAGACGIERGVFQQPHRLRFQPVPYGRDTAFHRIEGFRVRGFPLQRLRPPD